MKSLFLAALAVLASAGLAAAQGPAPANYYAQPPAAGPAAPSAPGLSQAVHDYGGDGPSLYFSADYLLWKIREGAIPATAATVPVGLISVNVGDTFVNAAGAPLNGLNAAAAAVGFAPVSIVTNTQFGGARSTDYGEQMGFRLTAGAWLDAEAGVGVEASFFMLERGAEARSAVAAVSGNQFLVDTGFSRNVFLVQGGMQSSIGNFQVFAVRETTSATYLTAANNLLGLEANVRCRTLQFGCVDLGLLVGPRYIMFRDEIALANNTRLFRPAGFPITDGDASASLSSDLTFTTQDRIRVYNHFVGGQIGGEVDAKFGSFFINSRLKGGVGTIFQHANVDSNTRVINNDPAVTTPASRATSGGLLVGPADVGQHDKTRFGFVGEFNLKVGYQITDWLRGYVGYDGLYLGHVARAGASSVINTLNTNVRVANSTNNVNVSAPAFRFNDQDLWAQGVNFGFELSY